MMAYIKDANPYYSVYIYSSLLDRQDRLLIYTSCQDTQRFVSGAGCTDHLVKGSWVAVSCIYISTYAELTSNRELHIKLFILEE